MKKPGLHFAQAVSITLLLSLIGTGYFIYQNHLLKQKKVALERGLLHTTTELASTTQTLEDTFHALQESQAQLASTTASLSDTIGLLQETQSARNDLEQKLAEQKNQVDLLASKVKNIGDNVGVLVKLSKTDSELLKKYSKVYFLNENYVPAKFRQLDTQYVFGQRELFMHGDVWPFLQNLLDAASSSGLNLQVASAYRGFGVQADLKTSYKITYGSGANKFSADQGYSEHQLGTTVDFTTTKLGADFSTFDKVNAYQWLTNNAYKYGFILSYPKNNAYYQFEPWHWRFVGRGLAEKLHNDHKNFYDLDQREIDKFLVSFFD